LACERRTAEDLKSLQANVDESEAAVEADDIPGRARANLEFHRIVAAATRNPVLVVVTDALVNVMEQVIALIGPAPNSMVTPSRRRLLEFIEKRDVEAAGREMEENLWQLRRFYLRGVNEEPK
jgi:GntR family transcriptional regulator, transcriptional repressor for pyruvate dehydrogenase complex